MKILLVHGIGHADLDKNYYRPWESEITDQLTSLGLSPDPGYDGFVYDDLFDQYRHGAATYATALIELLGSAAVHAVTDPLTAAPPGTRGLFDMFDYLRWRAGMVAQLAVESELRRVLRDKLVAAINEFKPDVLMAHSLGTLITYDLFRNDRRGQNILQNGVYVTFGSQINNPFARSRLFPGQIQVPNVRFWYHLFNPQDPVLTAPIPISDPKFLQVPTPSPSGHSPTATSSGPGYLDHPNTKSAVWTALARPPSRAAFTRSLTIFSRATEKPKRRALLIGINNYPDPANRLEGCVNDTFLMSSLLQERSFDAEDIRVLLDDRATADAIRERLSWLLDGAADGMERVLFYSGHGAQLPLYNAVGEIDHIDECLVPYDFDWTKERAITDDDFYHLYTDLPYDARFFAMFDCCHSGGLTRDGARKVRGLAPPDDIRHRMLCWDRTQKMWCQRQLPPLNKDFGGSPAEKAEFMGQNHSTLRLGRAMRLRTLDKGDYDRLVSQSHPPYLPVLLEACRQDQLSYEYRDGVTSYGAFTYSLVKDLRNRPRSTFQQVISKTTATLQNLGYDQNPQLVGPDAVISKAIPGSPSQTRKRRG
jgi:metacaspase-1